MNANSIRLNSREIWTELNEQNLWKAHECDDINDFAVFYNSHGFCVSPRLALARSASCPWGHFGAIWASMCREGSGGEIWGRDLGSGEGSGEHGSGIWWARIWECPCETTAPSYRVWLSSSMLAFFPLFTDSWNSGLTWSVSFSEWRWVFWREAKQLKTGIWRYWHCK